MTRLANVRMRSRVLEIELVRGKEGLGEERAAGRRHASQPTRERNFGLAALCDLGRLTTPVAERAAHQTASEKDQ